MMKLILFSCVWFILNLRLSWTLFNSRLFPFQMQFICSLFVFLIQFIFQSISFYFKFDYFSMVYLIPLISISFQLFIACCVSFHLLFIVDISSNKCKGTSWMQVWHHGVGVCVWGGGSWTDVLMQKPESRSQAGLQQMARDIYIYIYLDTAGTFCSVWDRRRERHAKLVQIWNVTPEGRK